MALGLRPKPENHEEHVAGKKIGNEHVQVSIQIDSYLHDVWRGMLVRDSKNTKHGRRPHRLGRARWARADRDGATEGGHTDKMVVKRALTG
jgi:hypothetical protein